MSSSSRGRRTCRPSSPRRRRIVGCRSTTCRGSGSSRRQKRLRRAVPVRRRTLVGQPDPSQSCRSSTAVTPAGSPTSAGTCTTRGRSPRAPRTTSPRSSGRRRPSGPPTTRPSMRSSSSRVLSCPRPFFLYEPFTCTPTTDSGASTSQEDHAVGSVDWSKREVDAPRELEQQGAAEDGRDGNESQRCTGQSETHL